MSRPDYYYMNLEEEDNKRKKEEENNIKANEAIKKGCFNAEINDDKKYYCPECKQVEQGTLHNISHIKTCIYSSVNKPCITGGTKKRRSRRRKNRNRSKRKRHIRK